MHQHAGSDKPTEKNSSWEPRIRTAGPCLTGTKACTSYNCSVLQHSSSNIGAACNMAHRCGQTLNGLQEWSRSCTVVHCLQGRSRCVCTCFLPAQHAHGLGAELHVSGACVQARMPPTGQSCSLTSAPAAGLRMTPFVVIRGE